MTETNLKKLCLSLYGIFGLSLILQFSEQTVLLGLLTLTIAYILMANKKEAAKGTVYESHWRWMYRTFWIGTAVFTPVAILIATFLIMSFTDITSITHGMDTENPNAMMNGIQNYIAKDLLKVTLITFGAMTPVVAWWLRRCWIGFELAKKGQPIEKVTTWL